MKRIFPLLLLLLAPLVGLSQTKPIAFKSHSGNMKYYTPEGDDNLGLIEPPPQLMKIEKIDFDKVVFHYTQYNQPLLDTVIHSSWNTHNTDSIQALFPEVKLVGFSHPEATPSPAVLEKEKEPKKKFGRLKKKRKS